MSLDWEGNWNTLKKALQHRENMQTLRKQIGGGN